MKKDRAKSRGVGTTLGRGKHFNIKVKLLVTKEVFTLKNVYNEMKIKELKSYAEFATGIPVHIQRLCYLDEGELLDGTDIKSQDIIVGAVLHMKIWNTWQSLMEAVATGDMEWLMQLGVSEESDFNTANSNYMGVAARKQWVRDRAFVALYVASHRGNQKMCEKLIRAGADVNGRTPLGRTALHVAAASGHGKIVDTLLENGADINAEDSDGESALSIASKFGHKGCERHLFLFRWQQRAKETTPETEHEMFAHQYFDSATPVWLKGPEAQVYYTQILPPAEYEGTAFSAPKRQEIQPRRYLDREETCSDASQQGNTWEPHEQIDFESFQQSLAPQSKKSGGMMPPISEEGTVLSTTSPQLTTHSKRGGSKQKKVATFTEWLASKETTERQARELRQYDREQKRLAKQDKK